MSFSLWALFCCAKRKKASLTNLYGKRVLLALTGMADDEVDQLRKQAINLGAIINKAGTVKPQIVVYNGNIEAQKTKVSISTDPTWLQLHEFEKMLQQPVRAGKSDTVESSGAAAKGNESMSPKRQRRKTKKKKTRKKPRREEGFAAKWSLSQGPTEGNSCIKTQADTRKRVPFSFTPETSNESDNRCTDIEEKVIDSLAQEEVISSLKQFLINRDVITLADVETVHLKSISIMTKSMRDRFRRNKCCLNCFSTCPGILTKSSLSKYTRLYMYADCVLCKLCVFLSVYICACVRLCASAAVYFVPISILLLFPLLLFPHQSACVLYVKSLYLLYILCPRVCMRACV